jgi:hypothetical protein
MIGLLGLHILQNGTMNSFRSRSEETKKKKQYYKLLNNKPMMIQITELVSSDIESDIMINASMIKKVERGFDNFGPYNKDEWSTITFVDDDYLKVKMSIEQLQHTIWREEEINKK